MRTNSFHLQPDSMWESAPEIDSPSTLLMVFGDTHFVESPVVFNELRAKYPQSTIIGASSSGGLYKGEPLDDQLVVSAAAFDKTTLATATGTVNESTDSMETGLNLARELMDKQTEDAPLAAVFVLSNGIHANGSQLIAGINEIVGGEVVVTGALAGDGDRFERTWVLSGADARLDQTVAVGLYGTDLVCSHGSQGGWDQFGVHRRITKSEGNVLYELDGKPALELYKRYLGDHASDLPSAALLFPMQVQLPHDPERLIVRTILAVDHEENSMTFAGDMPQGATTQLMKANHGRIVEGAETAGQIAAQMSDHQGPSFSVAVSCIGRKIVLQNYVRDELVAVQSALPDESVMIGMYSYGELAPVRRGGRCELHNQTMTVTLWSER